MPRSVALPAEPAAQVAAGLPDARSLALTVEDVRSGQAFLGHIHNIFDLPTATVTTPDDVAAWVRSVLGNDLRAAGFRIVPPGEGVASLEAEVVEVRCGAIVALLLGEPMDCTAAITLLVRLRSGERLIHSGAYSGEAKGFSDVEALERALGAALREASRQVVDAVRKAMNEGQPVAPSGP